MASVIRGSGQSTFGGSLDVAGTLSANDMDMSAMSGIVTAISAGDGISVHDAAGHVTVTSTGLTEAKAIAFAVAIG